MSTETITEYAEVMKERGDDAFQAVVVFHDGTDYWLSDGFHRHAAAKKAGLERLKSRICEGTRRDAILNSVGANAIHGLRRTKDDKRRAVSILLEDEVWSAWSNREIARRCRVDEWLVRKVRRALGSASASAGKPQTARKVERNGSVFEMNTGNIGRNQSSQIERNNKPAQVWDHAREPAGTELRATEQSPSSEQALSSDIQVDDLMSLWARAAEEVREQFLATIGVSLAPRAEASVDLAEASRQSDQSRQPVPPSEEPLGAAAPSAPKENALFEMWKDYKPNTQVTGRQWVVDGCPSEYRDSHFTITERLKPFRAAALAATGQERIRFLEIGGAVTA